MLAALIKDGLERVLLPDEGELAFSEEYADVAVGQVEMGVAPGPDRAEKYYAKLPGITRLDCWYIVSPIRHPITTKPKDLDKSFSRKEWWSSAMICTPDNKLSAAEVRALVLLCLVIKAAWSKFFVKLFASN